MLGNIPSGVSASDIMSSLKNVVLALSNLGTYIKNLYDGTPNRLIFMGLSTTSVSTLYKASSESATHINKINICNTSGSAASFSIFTVPSGGTAGASNAIYYSFPIAANAVIIWDSTAIIPINGSLQASASTPTICFHVVGGAVA